jgi:NADH-quinone oxidoreductase subunit G
MACMTPVADGMRLSVDHPDAREFRASVIEWLMLNHPHDCPVCDEGGECHLQDMTVMTGHAYRRTRFPKRTHRNQDLGPFVNHEMNRCIQCYRCVRFYRGLAGGRDLEVFGCHDHVYFGRAEDGVLESEFSGNLVEICPTGVFTDKTLKVHYARKWDLQTAPSICVHCGLGCNTIAGERSGMLRRILNRYHHDVNGYFLCDRGRFGYEFVNGDKRISRPLAVPLPGEEECPPEKGHVAVDADKAVGRITALLRDSRGVIGIGSPRASLESNFALRALVGPENFYAGMSPQEHRLASLITDILGKGPARTPSLKDVQMADAVFVLGEDIPNTAPLLSLALRRAAQNKAIETAAGMKLPVWDDAAVRNAGQDAKVPFSIATSEATRLDDVATRTFRALPDDLARLGYAVAHEIHAAAPDVPGLTPEQREFARAVASDLLKAKRPVIVSGTGCMSTAVVEAAANVAWVLCASGASAQLSFAVPECNTLGTALMGGRTLDEAFTMMQDGLGDTVVILENDLYRRAGAETIDAFLCKAKSVIVLDHVMNPTASRADVVLPAATFAESTGTLVNNEGRAQRFYQVFAPGTDVRASWLWINAIMGERAVSGRLSALIDRMGKDFPVFAALGEAFPPADLRLTEEKVPRQPHRSSGRTALTADISVHEPKPPEDNDTPLAFSMEGSELQPPAALMPRYWAPGWNSVQALNKFQQEVGGPLRNGGAGVRLIEPQVATSTPPYFGEIPSAAGPDAAHPPRYRVFGSEELSSLSTSIREREARDIPS